MVSLTYENISASKKYIEALITAIRDKTAAELEIERDRREVSRYRIKEFRLIHRT